MRNDKIFSGFICIFYHIKMFICKPKLFPGDTIPPDATLNFDVELVQVQDGEVPPNVFKEIDTDIDQHLSRDEVSLHVQDLLLSHLIKMDRDLFPYL